MNRKAFLVLFLLLIFANLVAAVPGIPHRFYGNVDFLDGKALDGFVVSATINGAGVASTVTVDGSYGYDAKLLFVTDPFNNRKGKTVEFYVNGIKAAETALFENGGSHSFELPCLTL